MAKAMLRARPTLVSGLTAITGESSPARRLVKRFQVGEQGAPLLVCELPLRHRLGELVALGSGGLAVGMMSVTHTVRRWRPLRSVDVAGHATPSARKRCLTTVKTTSDLP